MKRLSVVLVVVSLISISGCLDSRQKPKLHSVIKSGVYLKLDNQDIPWEAKKKDCVGGSFKVIWYDQDNDGCRDYAILYHLLKDSKVWVISSIRSNKWLYAKMDKRALSITLIMANEQLLTWLK